jgi:exopolyphosphatase / guanosine-5'-triphosphate,3'-diphosphate pyrophosphatase
MHEKRRIAAAIDVGSNSVHLLVAELVDGQPHAIHDESVLLGLGAVVDLEGRIPDAEIASVVEAISHYNDVAVEQGATWITILATEPLRRAANRTRFAEAVEDATGRPLNMLSHDEEAQLTLLGVLGGEPVEESILVLDIGGGSSEIVLLDKDADPVVGVMPVGSARLTAAHVEDDPPTPEEVEALRSEAHNLLSGMPAGQPRRGIVVGGSGINLIRLTAGEADEDAAPDTTITRERIRDAIDIVLGAPCATLVELYGLRERRILQMAAGASLIEATLDCYSLDSIEASDASLREGAVIAWAEAGPNWRAEIGTLVAGI